VLAARFDHLGAWLCERLELGAEVVDDVDRVAELFKADLTTGMVFEFPELQGIMGDDYARGAGESDTVATGIREHSLPRGQGDDLPGSVAGAVVAICDRVDTLVAIIGIGKKPSGSADPFALRRAYLGIIRILLKWDWRVSDHDPQIRTVLISGSQDCGSVLGFKLIGRKVT